MDELLDNDLQTLNENAPIITKAKAIFNFSKLSDDILAEKLQKFLLGKGYKLESGTTKDGIYGKGSKIGRILLGAFVKRFAWNITIEHKNEMASLTLFKQAKGYAGGLIGVNQVNKEFNVIVNSLKQFHINQES